MPQLSDRVISITGLDGDGWEIFNLAREMKINGSEIKCIFTTKDRYKRYIATCYKEKKNLNQWMVRNRYAIAYRIYSKKYVPDEDFAKENKLGLWRGKFMNPEKWRKLN